MDEFKLVETRNSSTKFMILNGLWIKSDHLMLVTYDNDSELTYLELFGFTGAPFAAKQLCTAHKNVQCSMSLDSQKKFASIILVDEFLGESNVYQPP